MGDQKEWRKHLETVLTAVDHSIRPEKMSKREALGWLNLLALEVDVRREALDEEVRAEQEDEEDEEDEAIEEDDELMEAFEEGDDES
jgi:hypothetical protein